MDRQARNNVIESNSLKPTVPLASIVHQAETHEWQPVTATGIFDEERQILLRNRYFEGVYGFEVLTLFTSSDQKTFWVDRGWVKAGRDAKTAPEVTPVPDSTVSITGRLRLEKSLPQGSFFALPSNGQSGLISQANAQSHLSTENFYLDLMSGSELELTPAVPAELPELSDGPHLAYALQWVIFAGLVIYGRYLIRRDVLSEKEL
jgi:cytochrome oxidase assembly protein ShyY1